MNTIANQKALKSRISAGWDHDRRMYHFDRQHKSIAPFCEPKSANIAADALAVVAMVVLLVVVLLVGGM